jgi:hypothetical protein
LLKKTDESRPCKILAVRVERLVTGVHISTPVLHVATVSTTTTFAELFSSIPLQNTVALPPSGPSFFLVQARLAPAGAADGGGTVVIATDSPALVASAAVELLLYLVPVLRQFKTGIDHAVLP